MLNIFKASKKQQNLNLEKDLHLAMDFPVIDYNPYESRLEIHSLNLCLINFGLGINTSSAFFKENPVHLTKKQLDYLHEYLFTEFSSIPKFLVFDYPEFWHGNLETGIVTAANNPKTIIQNIFAIHYFACFEGRQTTFNLLNRFNTFKEFGPSQLEELKSMAKVLIELYNDPIMAKQFAQKSKEAREGLF